MNASRVRSVESPLVPLVVVSVLIAPLLYVLVVAPRLFAPEASLVVSTLVGLAVMGATAAAAVGIAVLWERRPLSSIGLTWAGWRSTLLALGIGASLSVAVPALSLIAARLLPAPPEGSIAAAVAVPWWVMALAVTTAAITEEILYRGYALERLFEWSGSRWFSSLVALALFTGLHASAWNSAHIVGVVIPMGAALTLLYWWRRNVVFVMIVHATINLPLVFMSIGRA